MNSLIRILVVDDEELMQMALMDFLSGAGYQVAVAGNGIAALEELKKNANFNLILSDVRMPLMDGIALLKELTQHYAHIPVIMLTSSGDVSTAVQAMRDGAVNYLLKPVGYRQLLASIDETLKGERPARKPSASEVVDERFLRFGELMIDHSRLVALFNGKPLELTPTEYEILHSLMQIQGKVLTFEEIAFTVQGMRMDRNEARIMLSTHLSNLRMKMAKAGCGAYLANKRGTGYYLRKDDNAQA